jgi:hypothetical protein
MQTPRATRQSLHAARPFPRPPDRCRILPGKLAVRGLPEAKRRDATPGSALMGEVRSVPVEGRLGIPAASR